MQDIQCIPKLDDWPNIVQSILSKTGWNQAELADRLRVPPTTINRLLLVPGQTPRYFTGAKLVQMYQLACIYDVKLQASA